MIRKVLNQLKGLVTYDADREFYAKAFPGTLDQVALMRFRKMLKTDLPRVLDIEAQGYNYPWKVGVFHDCLKAAHYDCWVCEDTENQIMAFCIVSTAVGEATILNLCIDPVMRKQGLGRKFMEHVIEVARARKAESVFLEVRPSNTGAVALYESMGFNEIGIRPGYYKAENGTREDALMMAYTLI
jgi:ribosomal-protein-alanine N-acetyltransferase